MARGQLALFARLTPASLDLEAEGPGRIVSLSESTAERNFTLAQSGAQLAFRVRTPTTGLNGTGPAVESIGAPLTRDSHRVWAVFDGTTSRLEVDGSLRGERLIAAGRIRHFGLLVVGALVAGVGLAAAALGAGCGGRSSKMRVLRCFTGGACFWVAAWATGVWSHLPHFDAWAAGFATAAVLAALPVARAMGSDCRAQRAEFDSAAPKQSA
jgi:hypothetical protein